MQNNGTTIERLAVNAREAAKMLGVSERTLWKRAREGVIPTKRIGGRVLFPIDALRQLMSVNFPSVEDGKDETNLK